MPFSTAAEPHQLEPRAALFYCQALHALARSEVPFLVGGAYALHRIAGVARDTKDVDVFVKEDDLERALDVLSLPGCRTDVTADHWLAKATCGELFVDVIFSSGNGVATVDDEWFARAPSGVVLGVPVLLTPAEEMLWSKAFVMERERFDGADVMHILHAAAEKLDWRRLLRRFEGHWRVLYAHLVLFGYVYPTERARIPAWVMRRLASQLHDELVLAPDAPRVCRGTELSRTQYLLDVEDWGYEDGRVVDGAMTDRQARAWSHPDEEALCEGKVAGRGSR